MASLNYSYNHFVIEILVKKSRKLFIEETNDASHRESFHEVTRTRESSCS